MDKIKIEDFNRDHPNLSFPQYRTLNAQETERVRHLLAAQMAISPDTTPLDIVKNVANKSAVVRHVNAEDESFDVTNVLRELKINPEEMIFVNWYRFDDIDEMKLADLSKYFEDLWYPVADAIDLFDDSLKWVLSIDYTGAVSFIRF